MNKKYYLFYEKNDFRTFFETLCEKCSFLEKTFLSFLCGFAFFIFILFAVITILATDKLYACLLLSIVWLFLFPGLLLCSCWVEKSFWVMPCDTYVLRHGDCLVSQKTSYDEVKYIVVGNTEPAIVPRRTSSKWYHQKYGDYINAFSEKQKILFTMRYSESVTKILLDKCIHAERLDGEQYVMMCREETRTSEEIQRAEQKIVAQYQGHV
ncbi:MAG: hypothetical protein PHN80_14545 [Hespellia sp.]|nr:hypothetical protein [Hespellia sp.]